MAKSKNTNSLAPETKEITHKVEGATAETEKTQELTQVELLLKEFQALKEQTAGILEQNKALVEENEKLKKSLQEPAVLDVYKTDSLEKTVTIVHTIQHNNGLSTYMKVDNLEIVMRNMGEKRTLSRQQFETLVGTYAHYFDMGFIALDSSAIELAEAYGVDCYNPNDKSQFTAKTLKDLGKMSLDKLEEIYRGLSESSKKNFLNYWLNKAYEKEEGFYDKAKMGQLDRLAETNIFAHLISTMK